MRSSLLCPALVSLLCFASDTAAASSARKPKKGPLFTFGVVTDVHYSARKAPANNRYYAASKEKLSEAVAAFDRAGVDFIVSLGDLVDNDAENYADIAPILDGAAAPVVKIAGNHDFPAVAASEEEVGSLLAAQGIRERRFALRRDGFRLMFLDANDLALYSHAAGSTARKRAQRMLDALTREEAYNARPYNAALDDEQLQWLRRELDAATAAREQVICLCHMPVVPLLGKYTLWNNIDVATLLAAYPCVKAFLAGHHHAGGEASYGGIRHLTFQGMVEGRENRFAIVEVYADRLEILGFGTQPHRTMEFLR